jgi:hypothetical protein
LATGELLAIFKQAIGRDSIGARADAILSSVFAVLVVLPRVGAPSSSLVVLQNCASQIDKQDGRLAKPASPEAVPSW